MTDAFLIDECLSPDLASEAHARGYHATHVLWRGLASTEDRDLMPLIRAESFIFVTANGRDFLHLYAQEELHPGLIIVLDANDGIEAQVARFGLAIEYIERAGDLINKVLLVTASGRVEVRDIPAT